MSSAPDAPAAGVAGVGDAPLYPSPAAWFDRVVRPRYEAIAAPDDTATTWLTAADLLGDGPTGLVALHRRWCHERHLPPKVAATWLATWFAGSLAEIVGLGVVTAGASMHVDLAALRWRLHPQGWPDGIEPGPLGAAVPAGHPWAADGGAAHDVSVVADVDADALAHTLALTTPLVEACRGLAPVGRAGLWNEVGDGLVMGALSAPPGAVTPAMTSALLDLHRRPGVPWRGRPWLGVVDDGAGAICVGRKGGCCLEFTIPAGDDETAQDEPTDALADDADLLAYRRAFPEPAGAPHYCMTCSFRDLDDAIARQLFWRRRR